MIKRFLFFLILVFSLNFVFAGFDQDYKVCEYDENGGKNCQCSYVSGRKDNCECFDLLKANPDAVCKCQYSLTPVKGQNCKYTVCVQYAGSGCYKDAKTACLSNGHFGTTTVDHREVIDLGGNLVTRCKDKIDDGNGYVHYRTVYALTRKEVYFCNGEDPFNDCSSNFSGDDGDTSGNDGLGEPTQKKVCSKGVCKCYNLSTGNEEACLGSNSGGGSGSGSGNSSGDSGSGSGGGSGSGNNNGSEDGSEDGSDNGHQMGDGLSDYPLGDLDTSIGLPDPKDIEQPDNEIDLGGFGVNPYTPNTGQCPAPTTVDLKLFGSFEISYEYFCSTARILRTVVIAFAWLSALLIIVRVNRG